MSRGSNFRSSFAFSLGAALVFAASFATLGASGSVCAKELRILKPNGRGAAYDVAASEFQKYYERVCGRKLEIVTEFNDEDEYVVIGGDFVNRFVRRFVENGAIGDFSLAIGTDQYRLLSVSENGRDHLILAGGRGRSTLYAVYEFFETRCGCRWFWDGDVVPRRDSIDLTGLNATFTPRLEYRGIRYFAHRGLWRFQAEHWSFDDWKREIDWCVKKRLNLFMLRIGQDDLFQKAFSDVVSYPDPSKPLPSMGSGYDNRNLFWSLEFRGQLRKRIMEYAFDRDLLHPEDFGTTTHWYSPTPQEYIDKVKPKPSPQATGYALKTQQVWDVREDENLDAYWKLTQASIDNYGKPEIFHTIGFAERTVYRDREDNFKMKVYFYRRALDSLRSRYPNAPVLLADWDFYGWWTQEEIAELLAQLDPKKTIVLDYTLDLGTDHLTGGLNLGKMGLIGKFPYIAGIFLAYERGLDIRGRYAAIQKDQKAAFDDPYCKGLVLWPESSHTDIFMLHYFTSNAWKPNQATPEELLAEFCRDRYGAQADAFHSIWRDLIEPSQLADAYANFWGRFVASTTPWDATQTWSAAFDADKTAFRNVPAIFERLTQIEWSDEFARRDSVDVARTAADRMLTQARFRLFRDLNLWREGRLDVAKARATVGAFAELVDATTELLALHEDYSLNDTFARTNATEPIRNPDFGRVLLDNATNDYCMSHQYEAAAYWYSPTYRSIVDWANATLTTGDKTGFNEARERTAKERVALRAGLLETPLSEMTPKTPRTREKFVETTERLRRAALIVLGDD